MLRAAFIYSNDTISKTGVPFKARTRDIEANAGLFSKPLIPCGMQGTFFATMQIPRRDPSTESPSCREF